MEIIEAVKTIGFEEPQMMLLVIPAVVFLYFYLYRDVRDLKTSEQVTQRRNYLIARSVVAFLVFAAMSAPFFMIAEPTAESAITVLLDSSASMNLYENFDSGVYGLYDDLKSKNDFAVLNNFSYGDRTAIGDALYLSSLTPVKNNIIILASDGNNNDGKDMLKTASNIDSIIFSIAPENPKSDVSVSIESDNYALIGINQSINVAVRKTGAGSMNYNLNLDIGGTKITNPIEITQTESLKVVPFYHTFEKEGAYKVSAEIIPEGGDFFELNNKFIKNINAVPGPKVLFITAGGSESEKSGLSETLSAYRTTTAGEISNQNLNEYDAVVLNNIPANEPENNYNELRSYVENGGGFVVVGGNDSYDKGGYKNTNFEKILPVVSVPREEHGTELRIMILVDISGSFAEKGKTVLKLEDVKLKAASIVEALGEDDHLGVIAFDDNPYYIQHLIGGEYKYLSGKISKNELRDKILRFSTAPTQGTIMSKAIRDAQIELGTGGGYVILLSDGLLNFKWDEEKSKEIARNMAVSGITILTVGIGENINTAFLKELSNITHGTYYKPEELSGLKLSIREIENKTLGGSVEISDSNHFITRNMELSAVIDDLNRVSRKTDAQVLVTKDGEAVLSVWRYGAGRVAAIAVDDGNEWADDMYESSIIYRTINWAAGGIESQNYVNAENYPVEYRNLGVNEQALQELSNFYKISEADKLKDDINSFIKKQKSEIPKKEYLWQYPAIFALLLFFADVSYRRIKEIIKLRNNP